MHSIPGVSFSEVFDEIFDGFEVVLLLLLSLLLILLLHLPSDVSVGSLLGIPLITPHKGFVCCEVGPLLVEFTHLLEVGGGIPKSLQFTLFSSIFQ